MAVKVNVTTNGLGTYKVFQGETEHPGDSGWKNCAEVHFYPNVGASINARYILETSYKNNNTGRTNYFRYEDITWNGQVWMHQDDWGKECRLMSQQAFGAADYISECKMSLTCLGEGNNQLRYQVFDTTKGYLAYLFSYYYLSGYNGDPIEYHQTTYSPWFDTGPVTDRDTYYSMIGKYPNCPLCAVSYYNDLSSDYPQSQSPIWDPVKYGIINDNSYEWQTRTYKDKIHSKYEFYFWHPFIEVTCDLSTNANVDYPGYYDDKIHYPGCKMPKCPVLSVYMDMSADTVYPSLPTPVWPTHQLCTQIPGHEGVIWFSRSNLTSSSAVEIKEGNKLYRTYDHTIYCGWSDISCNIDVYCYSDSESKYINYLSGWNTDRDTGLGVYMSYTSRGRTQVLLSSLAPGGARYFRWRVRPDCRYYFNVMDSSYDGKYHYLSSVSDNGVKHQTGVSPYDYNGEDYWFYPDGDATIIFYVKKNGSHTYLIMYDARNNTILHGNKVNLPILDA